MIIGVPFLFLIAYREVKMNKEGDRLIVGDSQKSRGMSEWIWLGSHSVVSDSLRPHGLYLLQEIFPTQRSNPGLLHCKWILYKLNHKGSPRILEWVAYSFSSWSSWPRNQTGISCIAGRFFTSWAIRESQGWEVAETKFEARSLWIQIPLSLGN